MSSKVAPTFYSVPLTNSNFVAEYSRGKDLLANGNYALSHNQAESLGLKLNYIDWLAIFQQSPNPAHNPWLVPASGLVQMVQGYRIGT